MITTNKAVKLNYNLRENDHKENLIESTYNTNPLEFVFGTGKMIPMFEQKLEGKSAGDRFAFGIPAHEAYGEINPSAILDLDINIFEYHGKIDFEMLKVGNTIPMSDSNGSRMNGIVKEVNEKQVKMDFNHPLAGKNLYFEGEILEVNDAETVMAHEHGHEHGEGGCGCGSGCGCH